ncbi:MAG: hypothetical protein ACJ73S_27830 [Mycobacteriales bacterium]
MPSRHSRSVGLVAAVHTAGRQGPDRTLYVALGDSYAAGSGIPTPFDVRSGCGRPSHSYPVLVADNWQSADATLVTLGIGGNDLDFRGILTRCVELDAPGVIVAGALHTTDDRAPCRTSHTAEGTDEIQQKIRATSVALAAALPRIHHLAPHARPGREQPRQRGRRRLRRHGHPVRRPGRMHRSRNPLDRTADTRRTGDTDAPERGRPAGHRQRDPTRHRLRRPAHCPVTPTGCSAITIAITIVMEAV